MALATPLAVLGPFGSCVIGTGRNPRARTKLVPARATGNGFFLPEATFPQRWPNSDSTNFSP